MIEYFHKGFFEDLITRLESINYCIIGDYEFLPDSVSHDIDIWTESPMHFLDRIRDTAKITGFRFLIINHTSNGFNTILYKKEDDLIYIIKIDVLSDASYKSLLTLVDSNTLKNNRKLFNKFVVANNEITTLMHFLYPLFEWNQVKEKYKDEISRDSKSVIFKTGLVKLFGTRISRKITQQIDDQDWKGIESSLFYYKATASLKFVLKKDFTQFKKGISFLFHNIKRFFSPTGYYIGFCGLDGAGKTTIINILQEVFIFVLKKKKVYQGYWRPYLLPELRTLIGKENSKANVNTDSNENLDKQLQQKQGMASLLKFFYYWLDYILGIFKFASIYKKGGIVLFDRHYIDMILHPQRFGMNLSKSFMLFMYNFIPKPNYTFFFWASPEEIHKRKVEFSKEEISQQIDLYMKIGGNIKNFYSIETNKTIASEIDEILYIISKPLNEN